MKNIQDSYFLWVIQGRNEGNKYNPWFNKKLGKWWYHLMGVEDMAQGN